MGDSTSSSGMQLSVPVELYNELKAAADAAQRAQLSARQVEAAERTKRHAETQRTQRIVIHWVFSLGIIVFLAVMVLTVVGQADVARLIGAILMSFLGGYAGGQFGRRLNKGNDGTE